jgi:hypothetical protein
MMMRSFPPSAAGTFRWVAQLLQRRYERVAMVALDFETGILDRAACAKLRFQLLEERLSLLQWYLESLDDRNGLSPPALPVKPDSRLLLRRRQACMRNVSNGPILGLLIVPEGLGKPGDRLFRGVN